MKKKRRKERVDTMCETYCYLSLYTPHDLYQLPLYCACIIRISNTFLYEHLFLWKIVLGESHDH